MAGHFEVAQGGRQVALVGDAELDEGAIWEALVDPMVPRLGEVLWIVDLNRQSLDRVVPDIAAGRIAGDVRGRRLAHDHRQVRAPPARAVRAAGGESLRRRIDSMTNEEYQRLLRATPGELRERLPGESGGGRHEVAGLISSRRRRELRRAVRDLGGHDLSATCWTPSARPTRSTIGPP